jgi:hypothetical protein
MLFEEPVAVEDMHGGSLDEVVKIAMLIYQSVLTAQQSACSGALTVLDLELMMSQHYRNIEKNNKQVEENKVLLKAFYGAFSNSGKRGYKANIRPDRVQQENNVEKKNSTECIHCGKKGHLTNDCWVKTSNKSRRLNNFLIANTVALALAKDN